MVGNPGSGIKHLPTVVAAVVLLFAVGSAIYSFWPGNAGALPGESVPYGGSGSERVRVAFSGGHYTEPANRGRPVSLIAGALQVTPEVFRAAFSGVQPAHGRGPTREEARANKAALMRVLAPHGVTNDRLDTVSNYYRYRPQNGEMWPTEEAVAYALVEDGRVVRFEIESGGSGYTSPPWVSVPGIPGYQATSQVAFSTHFEENGRVVEITLPGRYGR